jgi:hypothetical protein
VLRFLRNFVIVAAVAAVVAFAPGGGAGADAILLALLIAFLATLGVAGNQLYRENRLAFQALTDQDRGLVVGAVGLIVLMIAGANRMLATNGGTLLWIGLIALALVTVARIWARASSY